MVVDAVEAFDTIVQLVKTISKSVKTKIAKMIFRKLCRISTDDYIT
jgi:hypothetical protein